MEKAFFPHQMKRFGGLIGLFSGAAMAALLTRPLSLLPKNDWVIFPAAAVYLICMALGLWLGKRKAGAEEAAAAVPALFSNAMPKILDTSVLIDGRICDICRAGFLEGEMVLPAFVLVELRHIADSADPLRRARGRRGLDMLNRLREEAQTPFRIEERDYDDIPEVDVKLLRLSRELGGAVLTNDYNLNKVAGVTGVRVLNINELAGALRPAVLPGEEMRVRIQKEGREPGQGVAYLEDGTMVVVENGRGRVGESAEVLVNTVLQTSAGRMIFTRLKDGERKAV